MKRICWLLVGALAAAAAVSYVVLRPAAPPAPPFSGVRSRTTGVTYSQQDPSTGSTLVVRARVAILRDGKVGRLFRSPLSPEVELTEVEAELRDSGKNLVLEARAEGGLYDPAKGGVTLDRLSAVTVADRQVQAQRLVLHPDGRAEIPGPYEVYRGERLLGSGRGYSGPAAEIGVRKAARRP